MESLIGAFRALFYLPSSLPPSLQSICAPLFFGSGARFNERLFSLEKFASIIDGRENNKFGFFH